MLYSFFYVILEEKFWEYINELPANYSQLIINKINESSGNNIKYNSRIPIMKKENRETETTQVLPKICNPPVSNDIVRPINPVSLAPKSPLDQIKPSIPENITKPVLSVPACLEKWNSAIRLNDLSIQIQTCLEILSLFNTRKDNLKQYANSLADLLNDSVYYIFNTYKEPPSRLCKYFIKTILTLYEIPDMASSIEESQVSKCFKFFVERLLDDNLSTRPDGNKIRESFNLLILSIIDHCDITCSLTILFKELRESIPSNISPISRYTQIVLKCLVRATKTIQNTQCTVDYKRILKEVHFFFLQHPNTTWKDRDPSPINLVKSFLNDLIKIKKKEILNYLDFLEPSSTPHYISIYINGLLCPNEPQTNNSSGLNPVKLQLNSENLVALVNSSEYGPLISNITKEELKQILTTIYKVIFTKETTQRGLADLAVLMKCNPHLPVDRYIQSTAPPMRTFVEEGLKQFGSINILQLKSNTPINTGVSVVSKAALELTSAPQPNPLSRNRSSTNVDEAIKVLKEKLAQNNIPIIPPSDHKPICPILSTEEISVEILSLKERIASRTKKPN